MNKGSRRGPTLRRHKRTGRGYARFNGRQVWFGPYEDRDTHAAFAVFKAKWEQNGRQLPQDEGADPFSVDELCEGYLAHLRERHDERWLANNLSRVDQALKPLRELFGRDEAAEFSPKRLVSVRNRMISSGRLCRGEINSRVRTIRRAFKWAVAEEKVPASVSHGLEAVEHLKRGDFGTREGRQVRPVDREVVDATLPHLPGPVAGLVELMWWTGARPSELFGLRPMDIDRSGKAWVAKLSQHKTAKRGKRRELFFGPEAQKVLAPFLLRRAADRPLFSPAEAVEDQRQLRRAERRTPLYPSHLERYERERQARPDRVVGEVYNAHTFRRAVERAIKAANRRRPEKGLQPLPNWTPYQLRHAAATRLRKKFGLEMVRCLLGHSSATMSEVYAEVDLEKARSVMEQAG